MIAWYISEGWAIGDHAVGFSQQNTKYLKDIENSLRDLKCPFHIREKKKGKQEYIIGGFLGAFINNTCGKYCDNKEIPSFIFDLSDNFKKLFINEIIKGDGYKRSTGWVYTSTSNILITGLNLILISLGYRTSIKTRFDKHFENQKSGFSTEHKTKLTRYDLVIHENEERILNFNDFESAVIFNNYQHEFKTQYEYDLSIEGSEAFIGGVGLFALHNSSVDTLLAPFIREKFEKSVEKILRQIFSLKANGQGFELLDLLYAYKKGNIQASDICVKLESFYPNVIFRDDLLQTFLRSFNEEYEDNVSFIRQNIQNLIYALNQTSRWGGQSPFVNLSFDWKVPTDLADLTAIIRGQPHEIILYQDCQIEMDIFNKVFMEEMHRGDKHNRVFTFPIPTYSITKDFDWNHPNVDLLMQITAKYGIPYFQNYSRSGLEPSSIRAMCCRLNLNLLELKSRPGGMWSIGDSTGSIGVVTINLNRLGYLAVDEDDFFRLLRKYMDLAKLSLEIKRKEITRNLENGMMAFAMNYLPHGFQTYFSTIGLCGMHECCLNFLKKGIDAPEGIKFAEKVLKFMRNICEEYKKETGNLYNLEATPAESTSYRFARLDKKWYPTIITSGNDDGYFITNSTHLPVDATTDLIKAIEHQNVLQPLYSGGTIFHTFLGEEIDPEACKNIVRQISEKTQLPYFSITPTFSICTEHRYIKGKHFTCPHCGKATEVYSRIVGYFRPISKWNDGKTQEFKDRVTFDLQNFDNLQDSQINETGEVKIYNNSGLNVGSISQSELLKESTSNSNYIAVFVSPTCPRCGPFKTLLRQSVDTVKIRTIDTSTEEGLRLAREFGILQLPTAIVFTEKGTTYRFSTIEEIHEYLPILQEL
jgi:ribonucleoside-triphosphate reductase